MLRRTGAATRSSSLVAVRRTALALLLILTVCAATASAHARPTSVTVDSGGLVVALQSAVEARFLSVSDPGIEVSRDADDHNLVRLEPAPPGPVTVRVLSTDGHATRMTVDRTSVIGASDRDPVSALIGRGVLLAALSLLVGFAVVRHHVVERGRENPIRPPGTRHEAGALTVREVPVIVWRVVLAVGVVAGIVVVVATLDRLDVGVSSVGTFLAGTRLGVVLVLQVLAVVIACAVLARSSSTGLTATVVGAACGIALLAMSAIGHATAGSDPVLGFVFDGIHTLASAVWLGGLIALVVAVGRADTASQAALPTVASIVVRFSAVALICVGALVVTGVYRGLAELPSVSSLTSTWYGVTLLVKLGVFALMLVVASYNRFVIHPRLERAALDLADDDRGAAVLLRRSVRAEIVLALVVLATVTVLIATPPA